MIELVLFGILGGLIGFISMSFWSAPISIRVVSVFIGVMIGEGIGIYYKNEKKEQIKREKEKVQAEARNKENVFDYDSWRNKLDYYYSTISREIYCNCNRESLLNFYNHIWELEKEKYQQTFLKVWTKHVDQLRNIIKVNIDKPGYYCLPMMLRTMICLRSAYNVNFLDN